MTRKLACRLAALFLAIPLLGSQGTAHADTICDTTAYCPAYVKAGPNGTWTPRMVLDVANWSLADRAKVQLWRYRTSGNVNNQRWKAEQVGYDNGYPVVVIVNRNSGKCLDRSLDTTAANGNAVYQYTCRNLRDAPNQKWQVYGDGLLRNLVDHRCLDVSGPQYTDGAKIHVWDCHGGWSQRWRLDF